MSALIKILPYQTYSKSAKALKQALAPRCILKKRSTPATRRSIIINWGMANPQFDVTRARTFLNKPDAVKKAVNKLTALTVMKAANVSVPDFTTDINVAKSWIEDDYKVVCRKLLSAHSGEGASIAKEESELVVAPLYTKFLRKTKEFRVHVFDGQVIDYVQKKARNSRHVLGDNYNRYIRSYNNGWIMSRTDIIHNDAVKVEAIKAVAALGLDFGAVDIVLQTKNNIETPYVLEVNTAVGLEGTTVNSYANAIKRKFNLE